MMKQALYFFLLIAYSSTAQNQLSFINETGISGSYDRGDIFTHDGDLYLVTKEDQRLEIQRDTGTGFFLVEKTNYLLSDDDLIFTAVHDGHLFLMFDDRIVEKQLSDGSISNTHTLDEQFSQTPSDLVVTDGFIHIVDQSLSQVLGIARADGGAVIVPFEYKNSKRVEDKYYTIDQGLILYDLATQVIDTLEHHPGLVSQPRSHRFPNDDRLNLLAYDYDENVHYRFDGIELTTFDEFVPPFFDAMLDLGDYYFLSGDDEFAIIDKENYFGVVEGPVGPNSSFGYIQPTGMEEDVFLFSFHGLDRKMLVFEFESKQLYELDNQYIGLILDSNAHPYKEGFSFVAQDAAEPFPVLGYYYVDLSRREVLYRDDFAGQPLATYIEADQVLFASHQSEKSYLYRQTVNDSLELLQVIDHSEDRGLTPFEYAYVGDGIAVIQKEYELMIFRDDLLQEQSGVVTSKLLKKGNSLVGAYNVDSTQTILFEWNISTGQWSETILEEYFDLEGSFASTFGIFSDETMNSGSYIDIDQKTIRSTGLQEVIDIEYAEDYLVVIQSASQFRYNYVLMTADGFTTIKESVVSEIVPRVTIKKDYVIVTYLDSGDWVVECWDLEGNFTHNYATSKILQSSYQSFHVGDDMHTFYFERNGLAEVLLVKKDQRFIYALEGNFENNSIKNGYSTNNHYAFHNDADDFLHIIWFGEGRITMPLESAEHLTGIFGTEDDLYVMTERYAKMKIYKYNKISKEMDEYIDSDVPISQQGYRINQIYRLGDRQWACIITKIDFTGNTNNEIYLFDADNQTFELLADLNEHPSSSNPRRFVESDDRLFFVAQAPTGLNDQLWNLEQGTTTSVKNTTKESMGKNCQVVDNIIAFDHPLTMIKVYDLTGKLLMSGDSSTRFLDISKLPMGYLYWSGIDAYDHIINGMILKVD